MMMLHRVLHAFALVALLMQAALGAVSPVAVLCINSDDPAQLASHVAECAASSCCTSHGAQHEAAGSTADGDDTGDHWLPLTEPCEDGCSHCLDVPLPSDAMWAAAREDIAWDVSVVEIGVFVQLMDVAYPPTAARVPQATGPPELQSFVDAAIVRTTRILI